MWTNRVQQEQAQLQAKAMQQRLLEDAGERRQEYARDINDGYHDRKLQELTFQQRLSQQDAVEKRENSRQQESLLIKSRSGAREQEELLAKGRGSARKQSELYTQTSENMTAKAKPEPAVSDVRGAMTSPTNTANRPAGTPIGRMAENSANSSRNAFELPQDGPRGTAREATVGMKKSTEPLYEGGTQDATMTKTPMSANSHSNMDANGERHKRWAQAMQEQMGAAIPANRLGTSVELAKTQDYKNVMVQENLMPRLQEVVNRLANMSQSWVRVVVPVDSHTSVIVRMNSNNGRVKIHLSTPNDSLVAMIKEGWQSLTQSSARQGIAVDEPTFDNLTYDN